MSWKKPGWKKMKTELKLAKQVFVIGFVFLLFSTLSAALGVVQDYPTTLSVRAGETLHYGIRVQNPSSEQVNFAITVLKDGEVATISGASSGVVPAYSKQAVVFDVKLPETVSKQEYKPTFQIVESKPDDPAKFIDTAISPVFSFTVTPSEEVAVQAGEEAAAEAPGAESAPQSLYSEAAGTPTATQVAEEAAVAFSIGDEGAQPDGASGATGFASANQIGGVTLALLLVVGVAGVLAIALKTGAIRLQKQEGGGF